MYKHTLSIFKVILFCALFFGVMHNTTLADGNPKVLLETNFGNIVLELDPKSAPKTVENFEKYVEDGFYNGTIFHRVIGHFMIQGGGFTPDMRQKETRAPIANEANNGLHNAKYTVAMARTSDPNSATAQFFINTVDNNFLDYKAPTAQGWGYTVFGKVVEGQNIVDKIKGVPTMRRGMNSDVPTEPVVIQKAVLLK